jgi:hypothetical protein
MRSALSSLDTVITAVIVIFATAESADANTAAWADMTPDGVDSHLHDLTGVSGWRSIIESRDILRSTLIIACGSKRGAVRETQINDFTEVADRAFGEWEILIRMVVEGSRAQL